MVTIILYEELCETLGIRPDIHTSFSVLCDTMEDRARVLRSLSSFGFSLDSYSKTATLFAHDTSFPYPIVYRRGTVACCTKEHSALKIPFADFAAAFFEDQEDLSVDEEEFNAKLAQLFA